MTYVFLFYDIQVYRLIDLLDYVLHRIGNIAAI